MAAKKTLKQFLASSSITGIPTVADSEQKIARRVFWAVLHLVFTFLAVIYVARIAKEFLMYRTNVNINVEDVANTKSGAIFPAVSVMATRGLSKDGLSRLSPEIQNRLLFDNRTKVVDQRAAASSYPTFLLAADALHTLPFHVKNELTMKSNHLIISCVFKFQDCLKNMTGIMNVGVGRIFAFNLVGHREAARISALGGRSGLQLKLYVDEHNYAASPVNNVEFNVGALVLIHSPYSMSAEILEKAIEMPLGQKTAIRLRLAETVRQRPPYETQCLDDEIDADLAVEKDDNLQLGQRYSFSNCMTTCQRRHQYANVGCAWWQLQHNITEAMHWPPYKGIDEAQKKPTCDFVDPRQVQAFLKVWFDKKAGKLRCDCPKRCSDHRFTTAISNTDHDEADNTVHKLRKIHGNIPSHLSDQEILRRIIKLEVYYDSLEVDHILHSPAKTSVELVSEMGGVLGLFIGLSLLSLGEVVELVGLVLAGLIRRVLGVGDLKGASREALQRRRITAVWSLRE